MYSHHSPCALGPNRTASISHYYRAWLPGYMRIWVKFKEQRWDVHGQYKEFARVGRKFDVRMSCGLYNTHRRTSASLVPLWKWWVHYSSRLAAWCRRGKMTQTRCLFIRNWDTVTFRLPEAPELRDRYMIMIALLSLWSEDIALRHHVYPLSPDAFNFPTISLLPALSDSGSLICIALSTKRSRLQCQYDFLYILHSSHVRRLR